MDAKLWIALLVFFFLRFAARPWSLTLLLVAAVGTSCTARTLCVKETGKKRESAAPTWRTRAQRTAETPTRVTGSVRTGAAIA